MNDAKYILRWQNENHIVPSLQELRNWRSSGFNVIQINLLDNFIQKGTPFEDSSFHYVNISELKDIINKLRIINDDSDKAHDLRASICFPTPDIFQGDNNIDVDFAFNIYLQEIKLIVREIIQLTPPAETSDYVSNADLIDSYFIKGSFPQRE